MNKAALKKAYKQTNRPMGVYRIRSTQNNKVYIGYGTDIQARINRHKAELKFGSHRNRELQETWNSLGESALKFEVLDVLEHEEDPQANPDEELKVLAEMWIHKLEKSGYSIVSL